MMVSFVLSFFPRDVLDEILKLIESVSEDFPSYSLPFKGVHLLLGNDLAADKVVANPLVTDTPCMDQSPDPIEQELPDLYPSCAVTKAMAKKAMLTENQSDIDLTD